VIARVHRPGFPLAGFVHRFWHFDGYQASHARERALPTGTVELVVNLYEDRIRVFPREDDFEGQRFRGRWFVAHSQGILFLNRRSRCRSLGFISGLAGLHRF